MSEFSAQNICRSPRMHLSGEFEVPVEVQQDRILLASPLHSPAYNQVLQVAITNCIEFTSRSRMEIGLPHNNGPFQVCRMVDKTEGGLLLLAEPVDAIVAESNRTRSIWSGVGLRDGQEVEIQNGTTFEALLSTIFDHTLRNRKKCLRVRSPNY